jgi:hypothetical protein
MATNAQKSHAELSRDLKDQAQRLGRSKQSIVNAVFPHSARAGQRAELAAMVEQTLADLNYLVQVVREAGGEYGDGTAAPKKEAVVKQAQAKSAPKPTATKANGKGESKLASKKVEAKAPAPVEKVAA